MSAPIRVQLSRARGWRMPPNTVKVCRPGPYGNPHDWREWLDDARAHSFELPTPYEREIWAKEQAVEAFRTDIADGTIKLDLEPLRGRNQACWCRKGAPRFSCHADVLLQLANASTAVSPTPNPDAASQNP